MDVSDGVDDGLIKFARLQVAQILQTALVTLETELKIFKYNLKTINSKVEDPGASAVAEGFCMEIDGILPVLLILLLGLF